MRHDQAVVIAQHQVPEETNEITQVAALLDPLDLTGAVITADAAHAQDPTAAYPTAQAAGHARIAGYVRGHRGIENKAIGCPTSYAPRAIDTRFPAPADRIAFRMDEDNEPTGRTNERVSHLRTIGLWR
jgi:predicted transposase YbfD/YdcC